MSDAGATARGAAAAPVGEALLRAALALEGGVSGPPRTRRGAALRLDGDHALNPGLAPLEALTPAAVLCALTPRPSGLCVVLTERPATMRAHAGQIAFPGGKIDPGDASPLAAALRESEEEVGLPPAAVTVLGALPAYATRTGYLIHPFVGLAPGDFTPRPEPGEVADVFETPLDWLMDLSRHERRTVSWKGEARDFWAMPWRGRMIWGATAGILRGLAERVSQARAETEEGAA